MNRLDEESRQPTRETAVSAPSSNGHNRVRKPYHAPRLKVYGRLAELTRFGGSLVVDSGAGLGNQP